MVFSTSLHLLLFELADWFPAKNSLGAYGCYWRVHILANLGLTVDQGRDAAFKKCFPDVATTTAVPLCQKQQLSSLIAHPELKRRKSRKTWCNNFYISKFLRLSSLPAARHSRVLLLLLLLAIKHNNELKWLLRRLTVPSDEDSLCVLGRVNPRQEWKHTRDRDLRTLSLSWSTKIYTKRVCRSVHRTGKQKHAGLERQIWELVPRIGFLIFVFPWISLYKNHLQFYIISTKTIPPWPPLKLSAKPLLLWKIVLDRLCPPLTSGSRLRRR